VVDRQADQCQWSSKGDPGFALNRDPGFVGRAEGSACPDMADAWFNLGLLQEKSGRERDAPVSYERAFAIDPTYANALHNAALLHMRRREFATAVRLLEQIKPTSPADAAEIRRLAHLCRLEAKTARTRE
jgi:Tfp pilus assembly protein PilF